VVMNGPSLGYGKNIGELSECLALAKEADDWNCSGVTRDRQRD